MRFSTTMNILLAFHALFVTALTSQAATADMLLEKKPDPIAYLFFVSEIRETDGKLERARAELSKAEDAARQDQILYNMAFELKMRNSTCDEDYEAALYKKKASDAEVLRMKSDVLRLSASLAASHAQADYSAGKAITIEQLYDSYRQRWVAECDELAASLTAVKANRDYRRYLYEVASRLYSSSKTSSEDVLLKHTAYLGTVADVKAHEALYGRCRANIPSAEMVHDMAVRSREP